MAKPNGSGANSPVAESRAESFMRSALDILGETGGTDFTVLDVAALEDLPAGLLPALCHQGRTAAGAGRGGS